MFKHKHYVPILKGKQGEFDAIEELDDSVKAQLTPVIEVPSIPWDFKNNRPQTTIDKHLDSIGKKIRKAWDSKALLFVDLGLIDADVRMKNGEHPLSHVLRKARTQNLRLVPVTGLTRDAEYQKVATAAVAEDKLGACIRLQPADFDNPNLKIDLNDLLSELKVGSREETDILLDFGTILPRQAGMLATAARTVIGTLPYVSEWRSLTVAATAFPEALSAVVGTASDLIDRTEWDVWLQLILKSQARLARLPTYGDYAIQNPEQKEFDPRQMHPAASIRYTADDKWLIIRGRDTQRFGYSQFRTLCADLLTKPQYCGDKHCPGDGYIKQCAEGSKGSGSLPRRRVGTVHHLTRVTEMIAKLP